MVAAAARGSEEQFAFIADIAMGKSSRLVREFGVVEIV